MLMSAVIGHRGARGLAAENTLAGIELAARQGARWVELDIRLTADQVPILFHDERLDKLTGLRGFPEQLAWQDLQSARIRPVRKTALPQPFPLTCMKEALQLCARLGLGVNLEIKPTAFWTPDQLITAILAELADLPPLALVISSFDWDLLQAARIACPQLPRAALYETLPRDWQQQVRPLEVVAINLSSRWLQAAEVAAIKSHGLEVYVYTVNSVRRARQLLRWGVRGVFTDYPDRLTLSSLGQGHRLQAFA